MIAQAAKIFTLGLVLLIVLLVSPLSQASVQASIDRPVIYEGESFSLIISSDGRQRNMPDLSLLEKDFYVLGTGSSQQVQIVNGVTSTRTSLTISLQPKATGQFHIPSLRVGKELTNPIQVTVQPPPVASSATDGQHIFIETEISAVDKPVYLQQQIIYTVRLLFDQPILDGSLSEPEPDNALVEQLSKNDRYSTKRNGRSYKVIERRYAIFPEKSGELIIPPLRFSGSLVSNKSGSRRPSGIDPRMRQFFGGDPFAGVFDRGQPVTVQGKALRVKVLPRPASYTGKNWLPSAELKLQDSWQDQPPEFKVGEPVSRSITVQAKGLLATLIPTLALDPVAGVKVYPEKPVSETRTDGTWVYGISKQSSTYMPTRAGKLIIPELKVSWWDTEAEIERTAVLPQWSVDVLPGKNPPADQAQPAPDAAASEASKDSVVDETGANAESADAASGVIGKIKKYGWLLLLAAVLIYLFSRRVRSKAGNDAGSKAEKIPAHTGLLQQAEEERSSSQFSQHELKKRLQDACDDNDARAAAEALLQMAAMLIPDRPPKNLPALAGLLQQGGDQLLRLDRALYAGEEADWDSKALCLLFENGLPLKTHEKSVKDTLAPLYPDQG